MLKYTKFSVLCWKPVFWLPGREWLYANTRGRWAMTLCYCRVTGYWSVYSDWKGLRFQGWYYSISTKTVSPLGTLWTHVRVLYVCSNGLWPDIISVRYRARLGSVGFHPPDPALTWDRGLQAPWLIPCMAPVWYDPPPMGTRLGYG